MLGALLALGLAVVGGIVGGLLVRISAVADAADMIDKDRAKAALLKADADHKKIVELEKLAQLRMQENRDLLGDVSHLRNRQGVAVRGFKDLREGLRVFAEELGKYSGIEDETFELLGKLAMEARDVHGAVAETEF